MSTCVNLMIFLIDMEGSRSREMTHSFGRFLKNAMRGQVTWQNATAKGIRLLTLMSLGVHGYHGTDI